MLAIRLETIRDLFDIKGMTKEMLRAVLTHPNIAIVDREADRILYDFPYLEIPEGWVKEEK